MLLKDLPIRRKLMTAIMLTSSAVILLTCASFFAYEFHTFRQTIILQLSTLGKITASNSTAALAFDSPQDAAEILNALKAEPHIVAACLYDKDGKLFSQYPANLPASSFPAKPEPDGHHFSSSHLEGYQPVLEGNKRLGTIYIKSDLIAMYERFELYGLIAVLVIVLSTLLAYLLSKILQKEISTPILSLAEIAKAVSDRHDYSVRATKLGEDEIGALTDAFNHMLMQIQEQNKTLSEFNQKLEQRVIDRTLELQGVNKELESFSYSISHDLRTPLRSIHSYTNIVIEEYAGQLDEEGKKFLQNISVNTKRMGQLIDDLLSFSKLGRKELVKRNVSMKNMVMEIWEEQCKLEPERNVEFILGELPDAYVDATTIKQVWANLISNALKYTSKKEKTVIQIASDDQDGEITYYVKDNGAGFDMQYYDKLFGVFQRLHSQKEFEGTGAGLAIVQRIISKHGGKIWANAKLNEGATFSFSFKKDLN